MTQTENYIYLADHPCQELSAVFSELNIDFEIIDQEKYAHFLSQFLEKYSQNPFYKYPIWGNLNEESTFSVSQPFAWLWFEELLADKAIIVFFDLHNAPTALKIANGADLKKGLENCSTFNFYVSDPDLGFYFAFCDDHEILTAGGTAMPLLQKYYLKLEAQKIMDLFEQETLDLAALETQTQELLGKIKQG